RGGYRPARLAAEIHLSEIMKVVDAGAIAGHCQSQTGVLDTCVHTGNCGIRPVIIGLHDIVQHALQNITLAQLLGTEAKVLNRLYQIHALPRHVEPTRTRAWVTLARAT